MDRLAPEASRNSRRDLRDHLRRRGALLDDVGELMRQEALPLGRYAQLDEVAAMVASNIYDVVLGSRILGGGALEGGMPHYKYLSNRALTLVQNWMLGAKLSEYHTGLRAFSRTLLAALPFERNSDDFIFDNQIIVQAIAAGARIGELSCPTRYSGDSRIMSTASPVHQTRP